MDAPLRTLYTLCLLLSPLLLALSTALYAVGDGINQDAAGGTVQVLAFPFFVIAVVALTQRLGPEAPRTAAILLFAGVVGCMGGAAYGIDSILVGTGGQTLQDEAPWGTIALQIPGILFPVGMLAIGVASVVKRTVPLWAGVLLAVAAVAFPPSRMHDIAWLAIASDLLLLTSFAGIAGQEFQSVRRVATAAA